jgi:L,D-peptidoglycan transpeptidase YkuD (ErfK/YbiS/YcfS/YnhG family)
MKRATNMVLRRTCRALLAAVLLATAAMAATGILLVPHVAAAATDIPSPALASLPSSESTPLPRLMADTSGARQLLIATAANLDDTTGTLQVFDLVGGEWVQRMSVPARFGTHGLMDGALRKAGNRTTPTGIWAMPDFMFGAHLHEPAGTRMKYRRLTWKSWWSSKRGKTYNTWVSARRWTGEHIGGSPKAYEFAVSTGYNARPNPSVFGRGTGIFLHVWGKATTAGCIAISRANMIRVCKVLDRAKNPHFAVGTLQPGTPTSIWAY